MFLDGQNLSEVLLQKRQLLDMTLEEVQAKTGIKASFLKALETRKLNDLPPDVYVQGYLKSLSKLYGLELARLARLYKEERDFKTIKSETTKFEINSKALVTPKSLVSLGMLALFLLVVGFFAGQIRGLTGAPKLTVHEPRGDQQILTDLLTVSGQTEPGATVTINNQVVAVNADGSFKQDLHVSLGENEIVIKALNRFSHLSEVKRRVIVGLPATPEVLGAEKNSSEE